MPTSELTGNPWTGFSDVFRRGQREILALRLVRDVRRSRPQTWLPWILASGVPILAGVVSVILPWGLASAWSNVRWGLLTLLAAINAGGLAAAALAWNFATKRSHSIDVLLSTSTARDSAVSPISRAMPWRVQIFLPTALASIPFIFAAARTVRGSADTDLYTTCLAVAWTLFIVGNDIWWLIVPPLSIVKIYDKDDLNLIWHDPARTAGIRTFAEGYGFSAVFLIGGALVVLIPGTPWRQLLGSTIPYVYAALLLLSLWIGAMTQTLIYLLTRRNRLRVMQTLVVDIRLTGPQARFWGRPRRDTAELADSLAAYATIASAPNLPYGSAVVVQYVAAVVGSVVGFIIQAK